MPRYSYGFYRASVIEAYQVPVDFVFDEAIILNLRRQVLELLGAEVGEILVEMTYAYDEFDPSTVGNVFPYYQGLSDELSSFAPPPPPQRRMSEEEPYYNAHEVSSRSFLNVSQCAGVAHYIIELTIGTYNITQRAEFLRVFEEAVLNATLCASGNNRAGTNPEDCDNFMTRCSVAPAYFYGRQVLPVPSPPPEGAILEVEYSFVGLGLVALGFVGVFTVALLGQWCFRPPVAKCNAPPLPAPYGLYGYLHVPAGWLWWLHPSDKRVLHKRGARVCNEEDEALVNSNMVHKQL